MADDKYNIGFGAEIDPSFTEATRRVQEQIKSIGTESKKTSQQIGSLAAGPSQTLLEAARKAAAQQTLSAKATRTMTNEMKLEAQALRVLTAEKRAAAAISAKLAADLRIQTAAHQRNRAAIMEHVAAQRAAAAQSAKSGLSFVDLGRKVYLLQAAFYALSSAMAVRSIIRYGIEYNRMINTLAAGLGDMRKANEEFEFLVETSKRLRLDLFAVGDEYAKFVAAVKGTILEGAKAREIFLSVSKATLVLGLSNERTRRTFLALSQMASQTYVTAENLRQQFAEHVPGAMIIAARAMKMTNDEFYVALYRGKILASDLLPRLAAELEKIYGPQVERAANSIIGTVNSLKTAWERLLSTIAEGHAGGVLKTIMDSLAAFLTGLVESKDKLDDLIRLAVSFGTAWVAAWGIETVLAGLAKIKNAMMGLQAASGFIGLASLSFGAGAGLGMHDKMVKSGLQGSYRSLEIQMEGFQKLALQTLGSDAPPLQTQLQIIESIIVDAKKAVDNFKLSADSITLSSEFVDKAELAKRAFSGLMSGGAVGFARETASYLAETQQSVVDLLGPHEEFLAQLERVAATTRLAAGYEKALEDIGVQAKSSAEHLKAMAELKLRLREVQLESRAKIEPEYIDSPEYLREKMAIEAARYALKEQDSKRMAGELEAEIRILNAIEEKNVETDRLVAKKKALAKIDEEAAKGWDAANKLVVKGEEEVLRLQAERRKLVENIDDDIMGRAMAYANEESRKYLATTLELKREFPEIYSLSVEAYQQIAKEIHGAAYELMMLKAAQEEYSKSLTAGMVELYNEMIRDVQNTMSTFFSDLLSGSQKVWDDLGQSLLDMFRGLLADLLSMWVTHELLKTAETAKAAAERAAINALADGASSKEASSISSKTYWQSLLKLSKWGYTKYLASGAAYAGWGGATATGAVQPMIWPTGTPVAGTGGASAAGGGLSAGAWTTIFAAALVVGLTLYGNKNKQKRTFGTAAGATFDEFSGVNVGWGGKLDKTGPLMAQKLGELLRIIESGTGTFFTGLDKIAVTARNDKKEFKAYVDGVLIGTFRDMNEAILEAAKKAFSSASFQGVVDPLFKSMVENFAGKDAEGLQQAAEIAKGILDVASGLSDLGLQVEGVILSIRQMEQNLISLGVSLSDASMLSAQFAVNTFTALRRQILQEEETPKQQLQRRKDEAILYNAQLGLYRLEIQARILALKTKIETARVEIEAEGKFMRARREIVKGKFNLGEAEIKGEAALLRAQYELWNKELEFLEQVDAQLAKLGIDLKKIKIPTDKIDRGGTNISNAADQFRDAVEEFRKAILEARLKESTSPYTMQERLVEQKRQYDDLLSRAKRGDLNAVRELPSAYTSFLELAKVYSGGAGGLGFLGMGDNYRDFFENLEAQAIGFTQRPTPSRVYEGNIVFDDRFHETATSTLHEVSMLRVQERQQMDNLTDLTTRTVEAVEEVAVGINQLNRTASRAWAVN